MNTTIKILAAGIAAAALSIGGAGVAQAAAATTPEDRVCTELYLGQIRWTDGVTFGERPDWAGQGQRQGAGTGDGVPALDGTGSGATNGDCDGTCDGVPALDGTGAQSGARNASTAGKGDVVKDRVQDGTCDSDGTPLLDGSGSENAPRRGR